MKSKHLIYCLLAFCFFAMSSCGPDNVDYANKVEGVYNVKITPNINLKYEGNTLPMTSTTSIETTCIITKDDEEGNVSINIKGVNGFINDIEIKAYCSGLGMNMEDSTYDGIIQTEEYGVMDCDFVLKNPTTTISNAKVFDWNSTVSGECEINYMGLDEIDCAASGSLNFYMTVK